MQTKDEKFFQKNKIINLKNKTKIDTKPNLYRKFINYF